MLGIQESESPLTRLISFDKLLRRYDDMAKGSDVFKAKKAQHILDAQAPFPELREGFTDTTLLKKHKAVIRIILQDVFSEVLTRNEIKAASLPFEDIIFNATDRFNTIIENAGGENFSLEMRNMPEDQMYIVTCTVILNFYYGYNLDFKRPLFYDIPDINGVMRHYRILYNADFLEITPTKKAKKLTQADVDQLLDNVDDLSLWKQKIPPNSFTTKGFVISNMFDVTAEHSISEIKTSLISSDNRSDKNFIDKFQETFKSFFNLSSIRAGFASYNEKNKTFEQVYGSQIKSFILNDKEAKLCDTVLCESSYDHLVENNQYFAIADVDRHHKMAHGVQPYKNLYEQGVKSAILAPIAHLGSLLGVLELVSTEKNALNSVNAHKLDDVMPYIVSAVLRSKS